MITYRGLKDIVTKSSGLMRASSVFYRFEEKQKELRKAATVKKNVFSHYILNKERVLEMVDTGSSTLY